MFLSFQSPIEIPGVNNVDFLRMACNAKRKARGEAELDPLEFYGYLSPKVIGIHVQCIPQKRCVVARIVENGSQFSEQECQRGVQRRREKAKRNPAAGSFGGTVVQMRYGINSNGMQSDMAILDEIDSGLDIDALKDVSNAVNGLRSEDTGVLLVTHYKVISNLRLRFSELQRLLNYIQPDYVHVMQAGKILRTGDAALADQLEEEGYATI